MNRAKLPRLRCVISGGLWLQESVVHLCYREDKRALPRFLFTEENEPERGTVGHHPSEIKIEIDQLYLFIVINVA